MFFLRFAFTLNDIAHSVRNDFTGLAIAAFIAWKLTVTNAIAIANNPAIKNISPTDIDPGN